VKYTLFSQRKRVQFVQRGVKHTNLLDKVDSIKKNSLFRQFSENELITIAQKAIVKNFPPHTLFISQDETKDTVYFIVSGLARIYRSNEEGYEVNIGLCGPGDVVGEMAVIRHAPRSASVESLQKVEALEVSATDFNNILKKNPEIAVHLLETFSQRLQNNNIYMEEVLSKNLKERSLDILQSLAKYFPDKDVVLSQEELATIIGATRARVTEVLNILALEGKISLSHKKIHIT
jgi:CRP-like cAMP-binding protein